MKVKLLRQSGIRLTAFFIALILISMILPLTAFGVNGGQGGGQGDHTATSYDYAYLSYWYGARATVIDPDTGDRISGFKSVDFQNVYNGVTARESLLSRSSDKNINWSGGYCKSDYRKDEYLELTNTAAYNPAPAPYMADFPDMVFGHPATNLADDPVQRYFGDKKVVTKLSEYLSMDYADFETGKYKILVEPLMYIIHDYKPYVLTPTEAAIFNKTASPSFKSTGLCAITLWNAPRAVHILRDECGYVYKDPDSLPSSNGGFGGKRYYTSNDDIINYLGVAIISAQSDPKVYYHVYTSTRTPTDKSLPELNVLPLAEQLKHSKQVDDKSSWTCINPEGTTPTYEKITQSNGTQVDLYYATNDSALTTLLAAHQLTANGAPCTPPIIGVEALEKAVDKANLDPYPGANILHQYPSTGASLTDPKALEYKVSDQGLGKKKDGKDSKEYHVAIYTIKWEAPSTGLYYPIDGYIPRNFSGFARSEKLRSLRPQRKNCAGNKRL